LRLSLESNLLEGIPDQRSEYMLFDGRDDSFLRVTYSRFTIND
jgi:hypothetical protein